MYFTQTYIYQSLTYASSQFRITLFDEGTMTVPSHECVIGRARDPNHYLLRIISALSTADGGEYMGAPEVPVVIVDCGTL